MVKQAQPCIAKWNKPYTGYSAISLKITYAHTQTHHILINTLIQNFSSRNRAWFYFLFLFLFFSSTSLLLPTHHPPPSCTHAQSCNPMDCSPPGSSVHGLFQARILEWGAISFPMSVFFKCTWITFLKTLFHFLFNTIGFKRQCSQKKWQRKEFLSQSVDLFSQVPSEISLCLYAV